MLIDSHAELIKNYLNKYGGIDDKHRLTSIASMPQVRKTRRLVGVYDLDVSDDHKVFDNSVGMVSDWHDPGPIYEIPFTSLYGKIKNLYVAGRCMSVTDAMWEYSRVIPVCAVTGEACGTAAAMFKTNDTVDIKKLQEQLEKQGVKLHL